jgi:hypothetical protein
MSAPGLGCVKTPECDARVEASRRNCTSRESNNTAHGRLEAILEDCIFYILPMYEFLHSQGHSRRFRPIRLMSALPPTATYGGRSEGPNLLQAEGADMRFR